MAVLGKRKAPEPSISRDDADDIFRRHFEAQFAPIDASASKRRAGSGDSSADDTDDSTEENTARRRRRAEGNGEDDGDDDDDSEWGGLSGDDGEQLEDELDDSDDEAEDGQDAAVQVVDYSTSQTPKPTAMSKRELKAFMSSRPPDQTATSKPSATTNTQSSSSTLPEDAPSLLAQDLELRRLISESHLLSSAKPPSSFSSNLLNEPKLFTTGRIRQKATDMRVQALGSKDSILTQKSMPMNMRKGIVAAATARETKRRKEARENGVILERENKSKGKARRSGKSRDMGIDMPGMGRFRGAELKLNDREVKSIEGSRDTFGRRNGGRRR